MSVSASQSFQPRPASARPGSGTRPSRGSAARRSGRCWASGCGWIRSAAGGLSASASVSSSGSGASPRRPGAGSRPAGAARSGARAAETPSAIRRPPAAEDRGHRALAVEIDHQHPVAVERGRHRQMRRGRGLADAALEIGHRHDLGGQARGAVGRYSLALEPPRRRNARAAQHLVEGEPLRAALGLGPALRQVGVLPSAPGGNARGRRGSGSG
jgi:hypothetical protein